MPLYLNSTIDRRSFLKTTLAAAGAMTVLSPRSGSAQSGDVARWALLSDTHVSRDPANEYRGFVPFDNMKKAVAEVLAAQSGGALITGDLARLEGFEGDYAMLKTLVDPLQQSMPLCLALGNHDNRTNFLNAFKEHASVQNVSGKHVMIIETSPVRFIVLDTLMATNVTPGQLGKAQREWLRDYLKLADNRPTILFFHHTLGDADGCLVDFDRISYIIPDNRVKAVIFGHSHVYGYNELLGIHLINLPAVAYAFGDHPIGWVDAEFTAEGGSFTLHTIGGNQDKNGETTRLKWRT